MGLPTALRVFGGKCTRRTSGLVRHKNILGGLGVVPGSRWFVTCGSSIRTCGYAIGPIGPQGSANYYSSEAKVIGGGGGGGSGPPPFDKILVANRYGKSINAREVV